MRLANEYMQILLDNISEAVIALNTDHRIIAFNKTAEKIFGFSAQEMLGKPLDSLLPKGVVQIHRQHIRAFAASPDKTRPMINRALAARRKDGTEFPVEIGISKLEIDGETIFTATISDVTESKRAEARLRELAAIVETSQDAILTKTPDGIITSWNQGAEKMYGYRADEMIGQSIAKLMPPELPNEFTEITNRLRRGERVDQYETERIRKDGTRLTISLTVSPIRDERDKIIAASAVARDITKRKRAEEALRDSEERYRSLVENLNDVIFAVDTEGKFTYVSPVIERVLGYSVQELLGEHFSRVVYSDDLLALQSAWRRVSTGDLEPTEYRVFDKGRNVRWVRTSSRPLFEKNRAIGLTGIMTDITERKRAEEEHSRRLEQIQRHLQHERALHDIDVAITSSTDIRVTLQVFLTHLVEQLRVDAADVLLFDPLAKMLTFTAGRGFRSNIVEETNLHLGDGLAGRAALERQITYMPQLAKSGGTLSRSRLVMKEGFVTYYSAPLIAHGKLTGVLEVFRRAQFEGDSEWMDLLEAFASQAAVAIDNAELFDNLEQSRFDLELAYDSTIEGWSRALDLRDKETEGHTQRVTEMTALLARHMGISETELIHVRRGALLHDIGKMGVPDHILLKPDSLTDVEWALMRQHPVFAYELLSPIVYLRPALDIPYCHHENWDGSGYPRGLKGDQIPLVARIFAIVDVWDALRSDRPYRESWPEDKVCDYLKQQSGKRFDPQVAEQFLILLDILFPKGESGARLKSKTTGFSARAFKI